MSSIKRHKYNKGLNLANLRIAYPNAPYFSDIVEEKKEYYKYQRKAFGFDERETWGLDVTSAIWLYEHLMMYREVGGDVIDFSGELLSEEHRKNLFKLGYKINTLREGIDLILELLQQGINETYETITVISSGGEVIKPEKTDYLKDAFKIYGELIHCMWW